MLVGRAMVAGMAMAAWATANMGGGRATTWPNCTKHGATIAHSIHGELGGLRNIGNMVRSFTPLRMKGPKEQLGAYDMFVWGRLPRAAARTLSPFSDEGRAREIMSRSRASRALKGLLRILALTSSAPHRRGRACIPVAGPSTWRMSHHSPALTSGRPRRPSCACILGRVR